MALFVRLPLLYNLSEESQIRFTGRRFQDVPTCPLDGFSARALWKQVPPPQFYQFICIISTSITFGGGITDRRSPHVRSSHPPRGGHQQHEC